MSCRRPSLLAQPGYGWTMLSSQKRISPPCSKLSGTGCIPIFYRYEALMESGLKTRMDRLFNRHGDGRAVCVAADHGYMSDVTENVVRLRQITQAVIGGGVDGILLSPGQALRLAPLFQGQDGPALVVRADWM